MHVLALELRRLAARTDRCACSELASGSKSLVLKPRRQDIGPQASARSRRSAACQISETCSVRFLRRAAIEDEQT